MLRSPIDPKVPEVSAEEVKKALDTHQNFTLLDVRTQEEYEKGNIAASILLPLDAITEKVTSLIPNKAQKIYVYCLSGSRSAQAVKIMIALGYINAYSMSHGLLAWRSKQYPLQAQ
jgi:rhodanese-related sulfurtransferase